jgi:hypothetical protein
MKTQETETTWDVDMLAEVIVTRTVRVHARTEAEARKMARQQVASAPDGWALKRNPDAGRDTIHTCDVRKVDL